MHETKDFLLDGNLLKRLGEAQYVLVLTGAGMSAESGIPTFRDAQSGIWEKYRPEDLATPEAFEANPARVWQWYEDRREKVSAALPHKGHQALVELESLAPGLLLATQNVDGLHQLAGSQNVSELHGNIMRSKCHLTHRPISSEWLADSTHCPPRSPYVVDGLARPDVVWFGEMLPSEAVEQAMNAAIRCDFCLSIGTTSLVHPAASLPLLAIEHGASLVEVNPSETPLSLHADQCFRGSASGVLASLVDQLKSWKHDPDQGARL